MEMVASVVLITGDGPMQRRLMRRSGVALWSSAFDVILQKRGWVSVDKFGPDILDDPDRLALYDLIIIGWLPERGLTQRAVETLVALDRPTLIEGPLGVELPGICHSVANSRPEVISGNPALLIEDSSLRSDLKQLCQVSLKDKPDRVILEDKALTTREMEFDFIGARHKATSVEDIQSAASECLISVLHGLKRRYERLSYFFEDDAINLRMALALKKVRERLDAGPHCDRFRAFIDRAVEAMLNQTDGISSAPIDELRACLVNPRLVSSLPEDKIAGRLAATLLMVRDQPAEEGLFRVKSANLPQLMLSIGALVAKGEARLANALFTILRDRLYDVEKGAFRNCVIKAGRLTAGKGYCTHPILIRALAEIAGPVRMVHVPSTMRESFEKNVVEAWQHSPLFHQPLELEDGHVLARFEWDKGPAIFVYRNLHVMSFSALSWLVHYHTIGPLDEAYSEAAALGFMVMEELIFLLLRRMAGNAQNPVPQIAPWPWGYDYALCIRHDVDRIPDQERFDRLMAFHHDNGLAVSWYWLPWRLDREKMRAQQAAGHEIALHAVRNFEKRTELDAVKALLGQKDTVVGETYHGTAADFWVGAPTVKCSADAGLLYTELAPNMFQFPYMGYPWLTPDGTVTVKGGLVGLTHNASADVNQEHQRKSALLEKPGFLLEWISRGHQIVLLNHPDINFCQLTTIIAALPTAGRLDWTARQIAEWWRKTHDICKINIEKPARTLTGYRIIIRVRESVSDLKLILTGGNCSKTRSVHQDGKGVEWTAYADGSGIAMRLSFQAGLASIVEIDAED